MREAWEENDSLNGWDFWLAYCREQKVSIMERKAKCATCTFFDHGMCRRFPIQMSKADVDWCGEWRPAIAFLKSPYPNPPTTENEGPTNTS